MKPSKIEKYKHLVGKVTDRTVAQLAGVSLRAVQSYRAWRRIPAFCSAKRVDWDTVLTLGKVPDPQLACELGVTRQAVAAARKRRHIPSHRSQSDRGVPIAQLGLRPDVAIARDLGCSPNVVRRQRVKRGIPPYRHRRLQDVSDAELFDTHYLILAKRYNVCGTMIHAERRRRKGPSYRRPNWTIWESLLKSGLPNAAIARKIGCSPVAVGQRRKKYRNEHGAYKIEEEKQNGTEK